MLNLQVQKKNLRIRKLKLINYNQPRMNSWGGNKNPKIKVKVTRYNINEDALDNVSFEISGARVRVKVMKKNKGDVNHFMVKWSNYIQIVN